jgi:hypothetical protein
MDRAHEQATEAIDTGLAEPLPRALGNSLPELLRGSFGESERNNARRRHTFCQEAGDTLRDDLGLA